MLKKEGVERALLGIIRLVKEESGRMEALEESIPQRNQNGIRHYHHISVQNLRNMIMSFLKTPHLDFLHVGWRHLSVPKQDESFQFCMDYHWLNKKGVKIRYLLPLPEELFNQLGST